MKLLKSVFLLVLLMAVFLLGFYFERLSRTVTPKSQENKVKEQLVKQTTISNTSLEISKDYFDDFKGKWGNSFLPNGEIQWKAGDSKYAQRSAPTTIIHALSLEPMSVKMQLVKREQIGYILNLPSPDIDKNYSKYGELLGGYFSNRAQRIGTLITADVDKDGTKEEIVLTANAGGNHPPHNGYIIKNGVIILHIPLNNGDIEQAIDGNGFYVKTIPLEDKFLELGSCCPNGYRLYRVIYENGSFKPVWEQDVEYLKLK